MNKRGAARISMLLIATLLTGCGNDNSLKSSAKIVEKSVENRDNEAFSFGSEIESEIMDMDETEFVQTLNSEGYAENGDIKISFTE